MTTKITVAARTGQIVCMKMIELLCRFLGELGTVSPAEQRKELFGEQTPVIDSSKASTDSVQPGAAAVTPKDRQTKKVE